MNYTLTSIKKIYDKNFSAAENGTMPATIDFNIAKAAGHALDLISAAKNVKLDLTFDTYENMAYALVAVATADLASGMTDKDIKTDLINKAASYELFTLCNLINEVPGMKGSLVINPLISQHLLIKAEYTPDNSAKTFDVFKAYENAYNKCFVFRKKPFAPVAVKLDYVHKIITKEFLERI